MALIDEVAKQDHTPEIVVKLNAATIADPLSCTVELGLDIVTASATLRYEGSKGEDFKDSISIEMGYNGLTTPVFNGYVQEQGRDYFPTTDEIRCVGYLSRAQYDYPSEVVYNDKTDDQIIDDLLDKVGITNKNIGGEPGNRLYGVVESVKLKAGASPWDLINELDQITGLTTHDSATEVRREMYLGSPDSQGAVWGFIEGTNLLSVRRPRDVQNVHNKIIVTGLTTGDSTTVSSTWQAASSYVPTPPTYITMSFRSQLIESAGHASFVAERLLGEHNRIPEQIELECPGNPLILPGDVVTLRALSVGIDADVAYFCEHITHSFTSSGYTSRIKLRGGPLFFGGSEVESAGESATDISYPESGAGRTVVGGAPYSTVVVAASNSVSPSATAADYVCTGTNDHTTIELAISACTVGGQVLLLEGTYSIGDDIDIATAGITIAGMGDSTVIQIANNTDATLRVFDIAAADVTIKDLVIDGNKANQSAGTMYGVEATSQNNVRVLNCTIKDVRTYGIYLDSCAHPVIANNTLTDAGTYNIFTFDVTYGRLSNNYCEGGGTTNIILDGSADTQYTTVTGNTVQGAGTGHGILLNADVDSCTIASNHCRNNGDIGIYSNGAINCTIIGNVCQGNTNAGISAGGNRNTITGNVSHNNGAQGIYVTDDENIVIGNVVFNNSTTNGLNANIGVASADDCAIIGNFARRGPSGNRPDYGLEIQAGCNNIYVHANDLKNGGVTGALNDAGTGTDTTSDNRTA